MSFSASLCLMALGLLTLTACDLQSRQSSGEWGNRCVIGVAVAVGANGQIYREVIVANPNLPSSKVINGNKTFSGLVTFQQPPVMPQNQQNVNLGAAAGLLANAQGNMVAFAGDIRAKGTLYQQLGQRWVGPITNPSTNGLTAISYGNGVFVAVGNNGDLCRSTDYGATWGALVANPFTVGPTTIQNIAYGNNVFVIGGATNKISRSTDYGVTWAAFIATPFAAGETVISVGFGNGIFIIGSSKGNLAYSKDNGLTWTASVTPFGVVNISSIAYGAGVFVAVAQTARISRSTDGVTWSALLANPFGVHDLFSCSFGNGVFVVGASAGEIARSIDLGLTWGALITNPLGANTVQSMSYNFGVFQAGAAAGNTARSYDSGVTWGSLITNPFGTTNIAGIASTNQDLSATNALVAVGSTGIAGVIATAGWNAAMSKYIEQPYTPVFTNFGVVTAISVSWVIVGNRFKARGVFTTGIAVAAVATMTMPNGMLSDAASATVLVGFGSVGAALTQPLTILNTAGTNLINFSAENIAGMNPLVAQNGAAFGNNAIIAFNYEVPIAGLNV